MSVAPGVPLLDLKAQYAQLKPELDAALARVVESQYFILGEEVDALERELGEYLGVPHAIGCASGSDAILLALMALDLGRGDEVLCPTYTFFATAGYVVRAGAKPVFADIDPVTYNLDPVSAREAAGRAAKLKALLPVHLYGQCADLAALEALAASRGVPLIEDAAQAIGSRDAKGRSAGAVGALGCFSFFPTKNLGGFGDGGLVTTADAGLAEKLRVLRVHGSKPKYYHHVVGVNSRLDALQAAVLRVKLKYLEAWHAARARNAAAYDRRFKAAGARSSAEPLEGGGFPLRFPHAPAAPARHIYNQYVIRVPAERRDALRASLTERRIGTEIYYPVPLHLQQCFAGLGYKEGRFPQAERAARETLALPIYPELSAAQIEQVATAIVEFLK
ncbi:MAG: DegT/DnrJ/EryC1/StrS family aminotransferase [Planctomycetota bacterium]|nr:DegT/DnrJ/EryC1/StrS family aminotransferase [Planctomycetota bacterium]